ncbi:protein tyrosine phosphatase [Enterobacter sp. CC120223-11]|uniref:arsenate reductase/protein-tyrosine-phosphatase family protein n=1 Tax=Enterobacter sp. CC120223-11 TaxID=1378073 RepID=UPI000BD0EB29|nr:protein tyrosine phosphatase [Enterobacter sp. CC120223-11]SNY79851.1 protein-tyrosine phosphatase [Enterobacter sp. CC120223-11]
MAKLSFHSILVVCTGNICRSPTGERLLRQMLPQIQVDSAGTAGLTGEAADLAAAQTAAKNGLSLEGHIARKITPAMAREYNLILVMESGHIAQVTAMVPEVRGKTLFFGQWLKEKEIPDPYRKSQEAFDHVYGLMQQASQEWAKRLS